MRPYQQKRRELIAMMGGCARCGATSDLEIHHKNPEEKEFNPGSQLYRWDRWVAELEKCELLCDPCHKKQHAAAHGNSRMYGTYKCRCEVCVTAKRAYKKQTGRIYYARAMADPVRRAQRKEYDRLRHLRHRQGGTADPEEE